MTSDDENLPGNDPDDLKEVERRFLDAPNPGDEELDEELLELVESRERGSVLRPILMIAVIFLVMWVVWDWRSEVGYFFTSPDPVEIGEVSELPVKQAQDPDWEPPIEHNAYVSLTGMPTRITTGRGHRFFRLVGAEIYVQQQFDDPDEDDGGFFDFSWGFADDAFLDDGDSNLPERNMGPGLPVDEHRALYDGEGRLISFAADPQRVAGLKQFYGETYNIRFCEDYSEGQIEDLERQRLERFQTRWRTRYEQADEQQREERQLTPQPSDIDERRLLAENPVCVDAYLLQDGQRPIDQWWYLLFAALLSAFALFNVYKVVQWFRDWLKP